MDESRGLFHARPSPLLFGALAWLRRCSSRSTSSLRALRRRHSREWGSSAGSDTPPVNPGEFPEEVQLGGVGGDGGGHRWHSRLPKECPRGPSTRPPRVPPEDGAIPSGLVYAPARWNPEIRRWLGSETRRRPIQHLRSRGVGCPRTVSRSTWKHCARNRRRRRPDDRPSSTCSFPERLAPARTRSLSTRRPARK